MPRLVVLAVGAAVVLHTLASNSYAVRIMTSPSTSFGDPSLEFDNIALTPDGNTIVATGLFNAALTGDRVYSLPVPTNPASDVVPLTQLSTMSFLVNQGYDVAFPPIISPDGQTILYTHDNATDSNSIYTMPITGEPMATSFTGLFGPPPNLVAPGTGTANPVYSPNGSTIFFLNSESAFGGQVPSFAGDPNPFADAPDWDQLYSVPAGGGTPVAITAPEDGDIDIGLFAVTPDGGSIVYAPDNPIIERKDRGDIRPKLFSIPATGGTPTELPMPAPAHEFSVDNQLSITPDGQHVLFIGDYETLGKNELFSVPITGGAPTRVSDDLPFAGDVYSFAIAPDGNSVAYAAGQNTSSNSELFLAPITGGSGNSIRVSDPPPSNTGLLDVSTSSEGGQVVFSPDSTKIYYLGGLNTEDVNDLYVVDTAEKTGVVPKPFVYVGPDGGEFFDENNWEDAEGNNPPAGSIDVNVPIRHSLMIDGNTVVATTPAQGEVTFQLGGSLELTAGSMLSSTLGQLEFNPGSGLKLTDATLRFREDIILSGTNVLRGGTIESFADDVEFQDNHKSIIEGTTFIADDNLIFDNSATSITGAMFEANDSISLRYEVDVVLTDSVLNLLDQDRRGGIEDRFVGPQGEGSTLTLRGSSMLTANSVLDGIDLVLDDTSVATLVSNSAGSFSLVDEAGTSTITLMSTGAELVIANPIVLDTPGSIDPRDFVINGLTGLPYSDDPTAWNVTDWDGFSPLASLRLVSAGLAGDYNGDGVVDAADYTVWRDNLGASITLPGDTTPGSVTAADFAVWKSSFGASSGTAVVASVPEPATIYLGFVLGPIAACYCACKKRASRRGKR